LVHHRGALIAARVGIAETYRFVMFMLGLGAFNGLVLIAWRPARTLGWGVLFGSVAATLLTFAWLWVVVLPSFDQSAADLHMPHGVMGCSPAVSAPEGCGNVLIERRVDKTERDISWLLSGRPGPWTDSGSCEVSVMTGWHAQRTPDRWPRSGRAVIALTLLALLLVAAVPVALLAAVIVMMLGHVVGGLALFGGSVLAAAVAVALAGMTGMQHLRKLLFTGSFRVVQLDRRQYTDVAEPKGSDYTEVVQLDRSEYSEVR